MVTVPGIWQVREMTTGRIRGSPEDTLVTKCQTVVYTKVKGFCHDEIINILNV